MRSDLVTSVGVEARYRCEECGTHGLSMPIVRFDSCIV